MDVRVVTTPHCVKTSEQAYQLLKTFSMLSFAHNSVTQFWGKFLKGKLRKRSCHLLIQSLQFSCLVVFDSLRPHGHTRLPCPSASLAACFKHMFIESVMLLWNPESQNTPRRALKTVEYSLLLQRVQGESVPNKDPDVSGRPRFIPPSPRYVTGYMLATPLFHMTEFYNK